MEGAFAISAKTLIYKGYIYIALSVIIVLCLIIDIFRRRADDRTVLIFLVALSGFPMIIPLFFVATASDFRCIIWQVASSVMAAMMLVARHERPS